MLDTEAVVHLPVFFGVDLVLELREKEKKENNGEDAKCTKIKQTKDKIDETFTNGIRMRDVFILTPLFDNLNNEDKGKEKVKEYRNKEKSRGGSQRMIHTDTH